MSGHSHWATIKHKKGAIDAKRGKLWSKLSRAIIIAARNGGGDPTMNLKLRYAIDSSEVVHRETRFRLIRFLHGGSSGAMLPSAGALMAECLDKTLRLTPPVSREARAVK